MKELKEGMEDQPETVVYGNAANSSKIHRLLQEDEDLEMSNYKRINYTKKEKKDIAKKMKKIENSDIYGDGMKDFEQIQNFLGEKEKSNTDKR
jgi:hypothetical protein